MMGTPRSTAKGHPTIPAIAYEATAKVIRLHPDWTGERFAAVPSITKYMANVEGRNEADALYIAAENMVIQRTYRPT